MLECQRCFWLTQHKIWKRPNGIFPSLPSGIDCLLKKYFDKFRVAGKCPPEIESTLGSEINLFDNLNLIDEWRNNFKGIRFIDKEGNILSGAVDDLLLNDKTKKLIVIDYKTRGFDLKEGTTDLYKNQLDVYNLILRSKGYQTEDYSYLLFYIPKNIKENGEIKFDTKLIKIKVDINSAKMLFLKALAVLEGYCPEERYNWCKNVEQS